LASRFVFTKGVKTNIEIGRRKMSGIKVLMTNKGVISTSHVRKLLSMQQQILQGTQTSFSSNWTKMS
jgi:hypothetical protein